MRAAGFSKCQKHVDRDRAGKLAARRRVNAQYEEPSALCVACGVPRARKTKNNLCPTCRQQARHKKVWADLCADPAAYAAEAERRKACRARRREEDPTYRKKAQEWKRVAHERRKAADPKREWLITTLANRRTRATHKGREFTIRVSDLLPLPDVCPVLGLKLDYIGVGKAQPTSPSIDRIDNTKGYVAGNVRVISRRANVLKSDASPDELLLLAEDARRQKDTACLFALARLA